MIYLHIFTIITLIYCFIVLRIRLRTMQRIVDAIFEETIGY